MGSGYTEIDHSGDIGIAATGRDAAELLENATLGLFALMRRGPVSPVVKRRLTVASTSLEDLVVEWLGEVIWACGAFGEVYGEISVRESGANSVEGILKGEKVDAARHDLRFDVKAATYHDLVVERTRRGLQARVIFDL